MNKYCLLKIIDNNYDVKKIIEDESINEFIEPYKSYIIISYLIEMYNKDILLKLIKYTDYIDKINSNDIIIDAVSYYLKKYKIKIHKK